MRLTCLGTGGGRFSMIRQLRKTAGMLLELEVTNSNSSFSLYIDPGPGALVEALKQDVELDKLDALLVTHAHPDHYNDVEVLIEAMTDGCRQQRGWLLANRAVLRGRNVAESRDQPGEKRDSVGPVVSDYHQQAVEKMIELGDGDQLELASSEYQLQALITEHKNERPISFKLVGKEREIGFISDTDYSHRLLDFFADSSYLVINVNRPRNKPWSGYLTTEDALKIINEIEPEIAVITHFGQLMIYASVNKEQQWLEDNLEVDTNIIFARDGQVIAFDREESGLQSYLD